ncbi:hemerythrin domain-containing protein [Flavobacterium sp. MFBS3-15]|uniref:hemerythrin domain-containing protein n=1 Tax=Flavobacterium sp. MFBS3-15 TaxID=2989816 RepID=UPI0022361D78|nr:hemerythrin domain-containing protein [Flavobacterium sp. MFBS3-15]MCW4470051.1 hemerythrin domain-containing protein [Flavobacterium sp. MFBS3-15]
MNNYKRYNVFNNIHKGLRAMLFDTQLKIQQTDFNQPEAAAVIEQLETALFYFDEHADHEDRYLISPIAKLEPLIAMELENDHLVDHHLSGQLISSIAQWKSAEDFKGRELAWRHIFYAVNEFIAFNLYHMNKEENQLLLLLWKYFTDEQIMAMEHELVQSIDPEVLMAESRWMMRGLSVPEIARWLEGIRIGAPKPVYDIYVQIAREELKGERMAQVEDSYELNY